MSDLLGAASGLCESADPTTRLAPQMANVLDKLPKRLRPRAKRALRKIMLAATRRDAETAIGSLVAEFEAKYPKATACLVEARRRRLREAALISPDTASIVHTAEPAARPRSRRPGADVTDDGTASGCPSPAAAARPACPLPLSGNGGRGRRTWMYPLARQLPVLLGAGLLLAPSLADGQTMAERYASPALTASEPPEHSWLHSADLLRANAREMADGQPLRAQQVPRFLRPTHDSSFGFNDFLVLGDHPAVTFTRWDPEDEQTTSETWHRAATRTVAGRLASVFHPRWPASLLRRALRFQRWGVDRPYIHWGRLGVPGTTREFSVRLSMAPPNIPESPVIRINDSVQFASHVVNVRDTDFGDSRVQGGDQDFNFSEITRRFYEHFADEYEVIAVVSDARQFGGAYFHKNVKNDISGIGLPLFDRSADFGSAGVLQAVEGDGGDGVWASWFHVLHEQGHQYGEQSKVWESLRPPLDRRGLAPGGHTPLLFPGAVAYGAVLFGDRRVTRVRSAGQPDRHPDMVAGLARRGLTPGDVFCLPLTAGNYMTPEYENTRLMKVPCHLDPSGSNYYAKPVEGLFAVVDLMRNEATRVVDEGVVPLPENDWATRARRSPLAGRCARLPAR